ncbi:MAG: ABC transporter substrate-binding protein [Deltaproteobacteria bacterium]|nr:ABC transporter substrate-binding protein [Deltaproteobacteria bacterium]
MKFQRTMGFWRMILVPRILFFLVLGTGLAPSEPSGAASFSLGERREQAARKGMVYQSKEEILEGARKEAKVVVAPGHDELTIPALIQAFQKKYPFIKDVSWHNVQGSAAEQRQLLEMKAGRANVDAFSPHQAYYNEYRKFNPFKKYDLEAMVGDGQIKIPPEMIDDSGVVAWLGSSMGIVLYNSRIVPPDRIPTGWESCLDPQWKGKIYVDTKPLDLARLTPKWGPEKVLDFAKRLKENGPIWGRGQTAGITRLIAGEFPLMCPAYFHSPQRMLKKDPKLPIKMVIPDPLPVGLNEPGAVYVNAKSPHAGLLWLEFLASKEGQDVVESIELGRGSVLVEGTAAYKLARGTNTSLCGPGCFDQTDRLMERIAVEAWGFPKLGYTPK